MPNRDPIQSSAPAAPAIDEQKRVDEASAESMDASDPPAYGGVSAIGAPPPATPDHDPAMREAIRRRAHQLWEEAGRPDGADVRFWLQAERELGA